MSSADVLNAPSSADPEQDKWKNSLELLKEQANRLKSLKTENIPMFLEMFPGFFEESKKFLEETTQHHTDSNRLEFKETVKSLRDDFLRKKSLSDPTSFVSFKQKVKELESLIKEEKPLSSEQEQKVVVEDTSTALTAAVSGMFDTKRITVKLPMRGDQHSALMFCERQETMVELFFELQKKLHTVSSARGSNRILLVKNFVDQVIAFCRVYSLDPFLPKGNYDRVADYRKDVASWIEKEVRPLVEPGSSK